MKFMLIVYVKIISKIFQKIKNDKLVTSQNFGEVGVLSHSAI